MDELQPVAAAASSSPVRSRPAQVGAPAPRSGAALEQPLDRVILSEEVSEDDPRRPLRPTDIFGLHTLQAYPENGGPALERQQVLATGGRQLTEAAALNGMRSDDPQGRARREQFMQTLEWAARNGLDVNVRLDYDWGHNVPEDEAGRRRYAEWVHDFIKEADARTQAAGGSTVRTWILGNEPNLPHENGGRAMHPARYVDAVRAVRERLDQDPATHATSLATAGLSPAAGANEYFERMQQAGVGRYVDAYGVHAYSDDLGPVAAVDGIARKYGAERPVVISEFGIPRHNGMSEGEQARQVTDFVQRALEWNRDPGHAPIQGVTLWKANRGPGEEAYLPTPTLLQALSDMNRQPYAQPPSGMDWPGAGPAIAAPAAAAPGSGHAVGGPLGPTPVAPTSREAGSAAGDPLRAHASAARGVDDPSAMPSATTGDSLLDLLLLFEWLLELLQSSAHASPDSPYVGAAPSDSPGGHGDPAPSSGGGASAPAVSLPFDGPTGGAQGGNPHATVPSARLPPSDPTKPFQVSYIRPNTDPGLPDNPPGIEGYVSDADGRPLDVTGWTIRFDGGAQPFDIPIVAKAERGPGYWEVPLVVPQGFSGRYNVALGRVENGQFVQESNVANVEVTRNHRRTQVNFSQSAEPPRHEPGSDGKGY